MKFYPFVRAPFCWKIAHRAPWWSLPQKRNELHTAKRSLPSSDITIFSMAPSCCPLPASWPKGEKGVRFHDLSTDNKKNDLPFEAFVADRERLKSFATTIFSRSISLGTLLPCSHWNGNLFGNNLSFPNTRFYSLSKLPSLLDLDLWQSLPLVSSLFLPEGAEKKIMAISVFRSCRTV